MVVQHFSSPTPIRQVLLCEGGQARGGSGHQAIRAIHMPSHNLQLISGQGIKQNPFSMEDPWILSTEVILGRTMTPRTPLPHTQTLALCLTTPTTHHSTANTRNTK
ncbi:hypothetical protein E2C01_062604 [Portunus trituberculatus]|uniref:Uncharacterized protein n=1 Tax=Portunus trituberculatus TaxID=210409 RepID=A0A5B7HII0_PORTR|nr:hypothetical protein [Portunus trituberculatus]